jgi:endonuclease/exonuclease/phosphatase (EEP) superfamily protein YafD
VGRVLRQLGVLVSAGKARAASRKDAGPVLTRWGKFGRLLVASMAVVALATSWLCHVGPAWHVLLVLMVYAPLPLLGIPAVLSLWVSMFLPVWWRVVAGISLVLVFTVVMGLAWGSADDGAGRVRFMTYNVKAFLASQRLGGFESLAVEVATHDADVIVMQDAGELVRVRDREDKSLWQAMFGSREVYLFGQYVVASRFPLRDCRPGSIPYRDKEHSYVRCMVKAGKREFELVTVHFVTPRQGLNAFRHEGFDGLDTWQENVSDRTTQAVELVDQLRGHQHPLVLAGDLNAPERSEVVRLLMAQLGLRDAFSSAGFGYGYTHGHSLRVGLSFLRIDHILVSEDIGVSAVDVGGAMASDHRPVIADLLLERER